MTNELQTLCAILRGDVTATPGGEARERLLHEARVHRVDRLVAWRTSQVDADMRAEALLEEVEVRELNRVLAGLESHGVVPIVLKGAALAHSHYEESWLRPRLDSDLLISSSQREVVTTVLGDLGYTRPPFITGELVMYQMPFERIGVTGQTHALDLHWRLANPQMLASLPDYDELSSRAMTIHVRGQAMRTPGPVDALLLACVHRAAHHDLSDELLWLYDIHLVTMRLTTSEWSHFVGLASRCQVRALCVDGLRAAERSFSTPVPDDVLARLADLSRSTEPSAVFLRKDLTRFDRLVADVRALSYSERARLLAEHVFPDAGYVTQKYGVRSRAALPFLLVRRSASGLARWITQRPRDTRSRSAVSSNSGCD